MTANPSTCVNRHQTQEKVISGFSARRCEIRTEDLTVFLIRHILFNVMASSFSLNKGNVSDNYQYLCCGPVNCLREELVALCAKRFPSNWALFGYTKHHILDLVIL